MEVESGNLNAGRPRIPPLRLLGARNAKAIQTAVRECAAHYGLAKGEGLPLLPLIRLLSVRNPEVTQAAVQECAANRWLDSGASNVERFFLPLQLCSNDSETMWFAVRQYAMSVQYADQAMEEYEEMARFAVQQSGWALRVVRADLKDDEGLVRIAEQQDKQIRLFASERVQQILSKRS